MNTQFKKQIEKILHETNIGELGNAIRLLHKFVRWHDVSLSIEELGKISFLNKNYPLTQEGIDRYAPKIYSVFNDLSDEGIKNEVEKNCMELLELIEQNEIEVKLNNFMHQFDLQHVTEFPFHCEILKDRNEVSVPAFKNIDKFKIKEHIAKGQINNAIQYLLDKWNDNSLLNLKNEIVIQSNRFNINEKQWNNGVISTSDYNIETIRISKAILNIIDSFEGRDNIQWSGLVITDLILSKNEKGVEFDFRLLNEGDSGIMLNRIFFRVIDIHVYYSLGFVEPTKKYGFDITSLEEVDDEAELVISHFIKPNEVDRFKINVFAEKEGMGTRELLLNINFKTSKGIIGGPPVRCVLE